MKRLFHFFSAGFFFILSIVVVSPPDGLSANEVHEEIRILLEHHTPELSGDQWYEDTTAIEERWLFDVYEMSAFQPIWLTETGVRPEAMILMEKLLNADQHGLDSSQYGGDHLVALYDSRDPAERALLDLALTAGFLSYAHDVSEGRRKARSAYPELFAEAGNDEFDPHYAMSQLSLVDGIAYYLDDLAPQHRYYRLLKEALAHYRTLEELGGWPLIPDGETLRPGDSDPRMVPVKEVLKIVGDLAEKEIDSEVFDQPAIEAIKRFQARHGLSADGVIGKQTLAAMKVPVEARVGQIELNLERWRWHLQDLGETYILVNIAGFDLKAVQAGRYVLEMPVIVGKLHHESPIFSNMIRYVEFNPFWNLTPHIARSETLPHLRQNPSYLAEKHIRLFSSWGQDAVELDPHQINWNKVTPRAMNRYKLRQDPGSWNALGTMKFVFPNKYSVYLHDTPDHDLFSRARRTFSHGCIRVSDPESLSVFLLGGEANRWDHRRAKEIVTGGTRQVVSLPERIPVHLTYLTAWHDSDGQLRFSDDVYNRDKRLRKALAE
jgi:murein L,D-transpeptidase YcbB/YkuD